MVIYGTRWGGTVAIAERISQVLKKDGFVTAIVDVKNNPELRDFDLIVIGSGISGGKWTRESYEFLKRHTTELRHRKTALFVSCGMVARGSGLEKAREDYLVKVARRFGLSPVNYGLFGGILVFDAKYNLLDRFMVDSSKKNLRKMGIDTNKPYDFRDWENIESWAKRVGESTPIPVAPEVVM